MSELVEIRDLFRVYPSREGGVAALQGLSLTVERGELCRARPERLGQVDAARIVAGFDRPSGTVRVAGVDVPALGPGGGGLPLARSATPTSTTGARSRAS